MGSTFLKTVQYLHEKEVMWHSLSSTIWLAERKSLLDYTFDLAKLHSCILCGIHEK